MKTCGNMQLQLLPLLAGRGVQFPVDKPRGSAIIMWLSEFRSVFHRMTVQIASRNLTKPQG